MDKYSHIIVPEQIKASIKYSPRGSGGGSPAIPLRDRRVHAENLQHLLEVAQSENERVKQEMEAVSLPARTGTYLEFSGAPAHELVTKSLEDQQSGIRLLNVRTVSDENIGEQTFATVFIPHGKENKFVTKLNKYANENTSKGKPKNDNLFRSIESINIALLRALWTDNVRDFPTNNMDWYEVWIRTNDSEDITNQHKEFIEVLNTLQIEYKANSILIFPERSVILIKANIEILTKLLQGSDQLAEVRSTRTLTDFLFKEYRSEQNEWVQDLRDRTIVDTDCNSVVCILDTGVNNGHPLLADAVKDEHCTTVVGEGSADRNGHGTCMCGVVVYGDMTKAIAHNNIVPIHNHIESIKILPSNTVNPKESWGYLTEQAVAISDVTFPNKPISYCMAITAEDCENGKPSSWSGSIDSITYNDGQYGKLFLVSAGNISDINGADKDIIQQYPNGNCLRPIQNPAQS